MERFATVAINPRTYKGREGREVGWVVATPYKVFMNFFLDDKTSAPEVF